MRKITVAIDGHSSCGKSTMAKDLARETGYIYIDTGAMYRAVTLHAMRRGMFLPSGGIDTERLKSELGDAEITFRPNASSGRPDTLLNGDVVEDVIRSMDVSSRVSLVAALPFVREAMVDRQRAMGAGGGVVMDGRDIGTVVFPGAELKVFVTASAAVRARRRYDELLSKGMEADLVAIEQNILERDRIDSHREVSPLRKAADAVVLDNSNMTIAEQKAWLLRKFYEAVERTA